MKVHLVGDGTNHRVRAGLDALAPWFESRGSLSGVCDTPFAPLFTAETDLLVILGGDGAILAATARLKGAPLPIIGIRLGHFGFLAELEPATCRDYLARILAGDGKIQERIILAAQLYRDDQLVAEDIAVNDAVVTAERPARLISLDLRIDGERVSTYRGDGLIVSSPLGSTAHSLAAGGPVVEPGSKSILVTPLASHTLASRPLVLDSERVLSIRLAERHRTELAALAMDGQRTYSVGEQDEVVVRRAPQPIRVLTIVERSYFETLRRKFRWGGSVPIEGRDDGLDR